MSNNILIIIPARGGSKRFPGKHIKPLVGRNLLERTQDVIAAAELDCTVILTTDDEDIADRGRDLGWKVPFLRPSNLAGDSVPTLPVVLHAMNWYREANGRDLEYILLLQVTSPLRSDNHLRNAVGFLNSRNEVDAVVGVSRFEFGPNMVFNFGEGGYLVPVSRISDTSPTFLPNGALYLIRSNSLRLHNTFFPPATIPLEVDPIAAIDIDNEADWDLAEAYISRKMLI